MSAKDVKPRVYECDWSDVVERLSNHRVTHCEPCTGKDCAHKAGPAFSFAELAHGATRATKSVTRIHALVFDLDHRDPAKLKRSAELIREAEVDALFSSTHSHSVGAPCVRAIVLPSRPPFASEWLTLWRAVNARLELHADEQAKDPARIYFDPTVPEGVKPFVWVNAGRPLDVDAVLASAPKEITGPKPTRSGDEWHAMLESIGDGQRNSTLASLAGALFRLAPALAPELAFSVLHAVNEARCKPPLSRVEVNTIADSIARKQGARS